MIYNVSSFSLVQGIRILTFQRFALLFAAVLAVLAFPRLSRATSQLDFESQTPREILLAQRALADSLVPHNPLESTGPGTSPDIRGMSHKSIGKAFMMNLALPGTGYLYAGRK